MYIELQTSILDFVILSMDDFDAIVNQLQLTSPVSGEQQRICAHVYNANGNLVIDSVAGSGKTTTLLQCLWFIPPDQRVLMLSFNKSVQQTMVVKVNQMASRMVLARGQAVQCVVKTAHAHGLASLKQYYSTHESEYARENKSFAVAAAMNAHPDPTVHTKLKLWKFHIASMLKMVMHLGVDCAEGVQWSDRFICEVAAKYGIPIPVFDPRAKNKKKREESDAYRPYLEVLKAAYEYALQREDNFDFDDMVYLPVRLGFAFSTYDVVLVDEAQDLSAIQVEMVAQSLNPGGRVIFVGDKNQSIYGFRGCLTDSMDVIRKRFEAQSLPLHTCWRCSQDVVAAARDMVPQIRARPGAPKGSAQMPKQSQLMSLLDRRDTQRSHMVLCRTNGPLIQLTIQLQKKGVPACMRATTVCENLKSLIAQIDRAHWLHSADFLDKAQKYSVWRQGNIREQGDDGIEKFDQLDSLITIVQSLPRSRRTMQDSVESVDRLFSKRNDNPIELLTIHQAKGLEADCVYVTATHLLPHPKCKEVEWQLQQENNAMYIAMTRARDSLYYFVN